MSYRIWRRSKDLLSILNSLVQKLISKTQLTSLPHSQTGLIIELKVKLESSQLATMTALKCSGKQAMLQNHTKRWLTAPMITAHATRSRQSLSFTKSVLPLDSQVVAKTWQLWVMDSKVATSLSPLMVLTAQWATSKMTLSHVRFKINHLLLSAVSHNWDHLVLKTDSSTRL